MRVLLLCGYRTTDEMEPGLGLERDEDGTTLIDRRIVQLHELGMKVVCVVAGNVADEQLRQSLCMRDTDLVFDNSPSTSLLTNTREGAASINEACFVLPVEIPIAPPEHWQFLINEYAKAGFNTPDAVLQVQGMPTDFGFPLLFTRQGCQKIQDTDGLSSLVDARLKYLHLAP